MFENFTNWIRTTWEKIMLIARDKIKAVFGVEPPITGEMTTAIDLWSKMYANQAPWLSSDIHSLNLAATIASEIARTVTIEMQVLVEGSPRADFLNGQMESVLDEIREQAEYGIALGGLILKPFVDGANKIAIEYVRADSFYPMEFDSDGNITSAIFMDKRQVGDAHC